MGQETQKQIDRLLEEKQLMGEKKFLYSMYHSEWTGLTVKNHKRSKGLKSQNLRDHMSRNR
jgi:hypothetical protein